MKRIPLDKALRDIIGKRVSDETINGIKKLIANNYRRRVKKSKTAGLFKEPLKTIVCCSIAKPQNIVYSKNKNWFEWCLDKINPTTTKDRYFFDEINPTKKES